MTNCAKISDGHARPPSEIMGKTLIYYKGKTVKIIQNISCTISKEMYNKAI